MSKILSIVHRIIWLIFFISIACNISFIYINIHNNRQSGSASERIENELSGAASSITSAERTTEQVSNGLITVSNELRESKATTNELYSTASTGEEKCGNVLSTIGDLRKQIEALENDYNNSVNSGNCD